ncbi:SGNH/GDSL hydrolase family protein [Saccharopolyspora sp. TS4A08]|uniref:SGNH/GDSL hydrolase family protein n=1 Tax=Saccharopolyspora ipomoeae TaxID=3042027 RepID=A0ABT6PTE5_9PSEU|nr:SGNH/GDSL hydrolase family protein [Saccharopolyspora sp. TS4A08]MDI2031277.1 SGNH/GDSL hydrolase family protein [Saccharopolyspora sp. TS4A08]
MLGLRLPVVAGAGVMALLTAGVPAAAQGDAAARADEDAFEYVAMGDSAAAGPLVPGPDPNLLCFRSTMNYPQIAAARLGAQLRDVTCSGADTEDFSGRQHFVLPPQYEALSDSTDLVTVTIGGNDVSLVQAAVSCLNALPEPVGASCADRFTADGGDELAERIDEFTPDLDAALDEIADRAPNAEVVVVGYGTYLPPGGCYPKEPMWARDADYIQSSVDRLSERLGERARAHGATFVDLGPVSEGHDVCRAPEQKYFEGVVPTSWAAPLHPNAQGMAAFGNAVADAVSGTQADSGIQADSGTQQRVEAG